MKIEDVRFKWTSGSACLEGTTIDTVYFIKNKNNKLYITNGNLELPITIEELKNTFTPNNCNWDDVEFDDVKSIKEVKFNK